MLAALVFRQRRFCLGTWDSPLSWEWAGWERSVAGGGHARLPAFSSAELRHLASMALSQSTIMQSEAKFNDAVCAYLRQHGHTSETNSVSLTLIGQLFKDMKPTDNSKFSIGRSLEADPRFQLIDPRAPDARAFAAPYSVPRKLSSSGGHTLVPYAAPKHMTAAPSPRPSSSGSHALVPYAGAQGPVPAPSSASGGFGCFGSNLLQCVLENVGPSTNLKVTLQNGQGQSICVERSGMSQPKDQRLGLQQQLALGPSSSASSPETPRTLKKTLGPSSSVSLPETPRTLKAPEPRKPRICESGCSCKSGDCSCHHFSPAFYRTAAAPNDRPHLKSSVCHDLCSFNLGCRKPDCHLMHSSPAKLGLKHFVAALPNSSQSKPSRTVSVTLLMCGETGSGKTTVINGLANLCARSSMKGRPHIKAAIATRYIPQSSEFAGVAGSEVGGSGVGSQTQSCASYSMTHLTPDATVQLQVIDTPGFSDTRGVSQDEINMTKIIDTVSSLSQPLTALVLVLNGATQRHTINVKNMVSRLRGNMPDAVLKNLVVVCTNCLPHTCNTDRDAMRAELGLSASDRTEFFYIQNSAFSSDPDTWTDAVRRSVASDWLSCRAELNRLVLHLSSKVAPQGGPVDWQSMRDARMRLKQALHAALLDTQQYRAVLASLDQAEALMKQNSSDVNAFSNFVQRTQQTVTELVDASYHSTICSSCNKVCHDHCGLSEISNHGDNAFRNCAAFSGDNCHAGSCKCPYTTHYHGRKTMRTTVKTLETVLADIKAKYDTAVTGRAAASSTLATLASSRANVEQSLRALGKRLLKECEDIRKICSGFNILDELYVQLGVMRLEASRTHDLRVRDQLQHLIGQVETLCSNLAAACNP